MRAGLWRKPRVTTCPQPRCWKRLSFPGTEAVFRYRKQALAARALSLRKAPKVGKSSQLESHETTQTAIFLAAPISTLLPVIPAQLIRSHVLGFTPQTCTALIPPSQQTPIYCSQNRLSHSARTGSSHISPIAPLVSAPGINKASGSYCARKRKSKTPKGQHQSQNF